MDNISREMEILRNNQRKNARDKNTVAGMKNAFAGFISRLDTAKERIPEFEDKTVGTSQT